jgi:hypothetical protein
MARAVSANWRCPTTDIYIAEGLLRSRNEFLGL